MSQVWFVIWSRPIWYQLYTYALAGVPIAFAVLFADLFVLTRRFRPSDIQDFLVAALGGIFTVLPLRLILVPSDIPGLSRIDLILGLGVVLLLLACIGRYVRDTRDRRSPEEVESQAEA
jgi:hypothetical protein